MLIIYILAKMGCRMHTVEQIMSWFWECDVGSKEAMIGNVDRYTELVITGKLHYIRLHNFLHTMLQYLYEQQTGI